MFFESWRRLISRSTCELLLRRINTRDSSFPRRRESSKALDAGSGPAWRRWLFSRQVNIKTKSASQPILITINKSTNNVFLRRTVQHNLSLMAPDFGQQNRKPSGLGQGQGAAHQRLGIDLLLGQHFNTVLPFPAWKRCGIIQP